MMDINGYTILFLVWLITTFLIRAIFSKACSKPRLPPSPLALPIIGHLHLLRPIPHQALHKLSNRYGSLFHLYFGSVPCIVASSPEMAKEFLKTHELSFCNRPSNVAIRCLTYGACGFGFAPYGPYWKFMKKLSMTELLGGRTLEQFIPIQHKEIEFFLKSISQDAYLGKAVNIGEELMMLANNIISRMTMGKRCSATEDEAGDVLKLIQEVGVITGNLNFQDFIGFCKNIDIQGIGQRVKKVQIKLDALMEKILRQHEEAKRKQREIDDPCDATKDLVHILLDIMEDENSEMKLTRESIKAFILVR